MRSRSSAAALVVALVLCCLASFSAPVGATQSVATPAAAHLWLVELVLDFQAWLMPSKAASSTPATNPPVPPRRYLTADDCGAGIDPTGKCKP